MHHVLSNEELALLAELRDSPPAKNATLSPPLTLGERLADTLTVAVGSWRFIVVQTLLLAVWIAVNVWGWIGGWVSPSLHSPQSRPVIPSRVRRPHHHDELK